MAPQITAENQQARGDGSGTRGREAAATLEDTLTRIREYAEENPEKFALYCLGIGFVLGWKLKPW
jgi:hypothetical protein